MIYSNKGVLQIIIRSDFFYICVIFIRIQLTKIYILPSIKLRNKNNTIIVRIGRNRDIADYFGRYLRAGQNNASRQILYLVLAFKEINIF